MSTLRFIMVGGFLGAGKTTTLGRLAKYYASRGQQVGIVTNDQAADLVDTHTLRSQGLDVAEVAGACFCCRFDDLVSRVGDLEKNRPSVILAEPVGSCTDLVATVVQPLKNLYGDKFTIAPYSVIFKPSHGLKILKNETGAGFSPKAAYIFRKQLEEADAILINRIDELDTEQRDELMQLVRENYAGVPIHPISAKTGEGFEAFSELLDQEGNFGQRILDIDYDIYAEGEAELGWLNSSMRLTATNSFSLDDLLLDVINTLHDSLRQANAEVAHLKAIGLWEGFFGVANLVSTATAPELSLPSNCQVKEADLIINARVAIDPEVLQDHVHNAMKKICADRRASSNHQQTQSFRPGRPVPTHRYAEAK